MYILIMSDAFSVPFMKQNLIPPFVMREAGVHVNIDMKTHTICEPAIDDH